MKSVLTAFEYVLTVFRLILQARFGTLLIHAQFILIWRPEMLLQRLHEVIDDPEGGCSDMRALSVQNGSVSLHRTSPVPHDHLHSEIHTRAYQSVPELLLRLDSVEYEEMR